ncbi:hypothetical protein CANMA_003599 [Candida margitis]|uniref:uncharacterized protein n=1 Tax=Candida margitis TaxID=1775924 RepID=UPI002226A879|nr:uncharacterized protein CANMA_003599 [Candida margitis]KAI5963432.1 hypothetical protein CANMA_003599 [Candida margitis]
MGLVLSIPFAVFAFGGSDSDGREEGHSARKNTRSKAKYRSRHNRGSPTSTYVAGPTESLFLNTGIHNQTLFGNNTLPDTEPKDSVNLGFILGPVFGVLFLILIIAIFWCHKLVKKQQRQATAAPAAGQNQDPPPYLQRNPQDVNSFEPPTSKLPLPEKAHLKVEDVETLVEGEYDKEFEYHEVSDLESARTKY